MSDISSAQSTFQIGQTDEWPTVSSGPVDAEPWNDLAAVILAMQTRMKPKEALEPSGGLAGVCAPDGYQMGAGSQAWKKLIFASSATETIDLVNGLDSIDALDLLPVTFYVPAGYTVYPYDIRATLRGGYCSDVYLAQIVYDETNVVANFRLHFPIGAYGVYTYRVDAMAFLTPIGD